MMKKMIATIFITFLAIISSYNIAMSNQLSEFSSKKYDVNQIESFFDDIYSYNCEQIEEDKNVSLIFSKNGDRWSLNNIPGMNIEKTTNEFIIVFTKKGDEGFGVLKKENNAWQLQILTKSRYVNTICTSQDDLVFELSESIKPRILHEFKKLYSTIDSQNKKIKKISTKYNAEKSMAERSRNESKGLLFRLSQSIAKIDILDALIEKNNHKLDQQMYISETKQKKIELLNLQTVKLREQISELRKIIDDSQDATALEDARMQTNKLGIELNLTLNRVEAERRKVNLLNEKITELLEKEKERLFDETKDLKIFTKLFFEALDKVKINTKNIRIIDDGFVLYNDNLFIKDSALLNDNGKKEILLIGNILNQITSEIPNDIDWVLRVDGHSDATPVPFIKYSDNFELSNARALSVAKHLNDNTNLTSNRIAANGFGNSRPINENRINTFYKDHRRIELKLADQKLGHILTISDLEKLSLNNNELKAFIQSVKKCINIPIKDDFNETITLGIKLNIDGILSEEPVILSSSFDHNSENSNAVVLINAIRAIKDCKLYRLPIDKFHEWKEIVIKLNIGNNNVNAINFSTDVTEIVSEEENFLQVGINELKSENFDSAILRFDSLISAYPKSVFKAQAHYFKGEALSGKNEWKAAGKSYLESFRLKPNGEYAAKALMNVGINLARMDKINEACNILSKVMERFPGNQILDNATFEMELYDCK
jgi:flagellar motor protein MotB